MRHWMAAGSVPAGRQDRADRPAGVTAQTVKLPSGPTSLKGLGESFEPNMSTGTGSYSVKIDVPPGFLAPAVSLSYSGGTGKSELGMSWQLPFSCVTLWRFSCSIGAPPKQRRQQGMSVPRIHFKSHATIQNRVLGGA